MIGDECVDELPQSWLELEALANAVGQFARLTYPNVTGYGRPEVPASWVSGLKTRGLRVRLYGQSAIEITSKQNPTTYWFSAATLYPFKSVTRYRKTAVTSRFTIYKVLSGKAASTSLLSLRHAHPTARIVVGERAFYPAEIRLHAS